jgi:FkbM family methyltransferase
MSSVIRLKDPAGRPLQLSVEEALSHAAGRLNAGDASTALQVLERVVRCAPHSHTTRYLLGVAQSRLADYDHAIENLRKAVSGDERNPDHHYALAEALMLAERPGAVQHFNRALELDPGIDPAYSNLIGLLLAEHRYEEAVEVCRRGLERFPNDAGLLGNGGIAYGRLGRYEEAVELARRHLALQPADPGVWCNLGNALVTVGRLAEGLDCLERAVAMAPEHAATHYNLSLALLRSGDFARGFAEYEWRKQSGNLQLGIRPMPGPAWDGSPPAGRRILLYHEQGVGDTIQFLRYAAVVRSLGGEPVLEVPRSLERLCRWMPEAGEVVGTGAPQPSYDAHCLLMSLPHLCGTTQQNTPPPLRIKIPGEVRRRWRERVCAAPGRKVGIVWAGNPGHQNDRNRSIPFRHFLRLLDAPGVSLFSLQVGAASGALSEGGARGRIVDLAAELTDYGETAAAIAALDLVITVDTSVAHLAGTLGAPTWLLVPSYVDWRWMIDREDSPWYPSMRIFRQRTGGDWEGVFERVMAALAPSASPAVDPAVEARARAAAAFLPAGAVVFDVGRGDGPLARFLPPGCRYTSCDLAREALALPLGVTHVVMLGVFELIEDWPRLLRQFRSYNAPVVFSFCPADFTAGVDRRSLGWMNHAGLRELCAEIEAAGLRIEASERIDEYEVLLRVAPAAARTEVARRVLALSAGGDGLGARLGASLLDAMLPAEVEVQHVAVGRDPAPEGDFDLVVIGRGECLPGGFLSAGLLDLARRARHAIGVFGIDPDDAPDAATIAALLDRLDVWLARSEQDVLLYGKARRNVIHLGAWAAAAAPLTRWTRDATLRVGAGAVVEGGVDELQRYRAVAAADADTLACALASAESVEHSGGGDVRALLLDVFGRCWPANRSFSFDRGAVAAYRARVRRVAREMTPIVAGLLGLACDGATVAGATPRIIEVGAPYRLVQARRGWMLANPNDFYMGLSMTTYGECCEAEAAFLLDLARASTGVAVEVGCNMGIHTAPLGRWLAGENRRLIAFEPQPVIFQQLSANLALNGLTNVRAWPYACGAEAGAVRFAQPDYTRLGNFGGVAMSRGGGGDGFVEAPCVRLDDVLQGEEVGLIKIDVEGFELEVLRGAAATIRRCRPLLYVENDRAERSRELIEWLWEAGYELWWHAPPLFNPENHFGARCDLYPGVVSLNMVAAPKGRELPPAAALTRVVESAAHPSRRTP